MAEPRQTARKPEELIRALEESRRGISQHALRVQDRINPVTRFKEVIQRNQGAWIGGALIAGFVLARLPALFPRKRKVKRKDGKEELLPPKKSMLVMLVAAIRFLIPLFKPAITEFASDQLAKWADTIKSESSKQ